MMGMYLVLVQTIALAAAVVWFFIRLDQEIAADKAKAAASKPKRRRAKYKGKFDQ